jgi:hypothetical protein
MNSIDEIIELYKRDVDVTLLEENLRHTPEERIRALEEFNRFLEELRDGVKKSATAPQA